ncbi:MAG: PAS domain S-box protein [Syntrophobacteraceae bacterium]
MDSYRILIVENKPAVAAQMEDRLAEMGCRVLGNADCGERAVQMAEALRPDLILVDVRLKEAADVDRIASRFHLPMVFFSADSEDGMPGRARSDEPFGGIVGFLDTRELKSSIENAINRHRMGEDTQRMSVEKAIQESNEYLNALFEGARDAIFIADPESGIILSANAEAERLLGKPRSAIIGRYQSELHPPAEDGMYRGLFERFILEDCKARVLGEVQRADGATVPVEISGSIVHVGGGRRVVMGLFRDISERKRAEEALRRSEERYRTLLETTFDWIWEVDSSGRYTYASPQVFDILGYAPEEILGHTPFDFMSEEEAERVKCIFLEAVSHRQPLSLLENVNRHRDGRRIVLESNGVPVFGTGGEFLGYRGIDRDVTARKEAEEQRARTEAQLRQAQKMEALGTLAGGIAHDFNNILGIIIGYTEMIEWEAGKDSPLQKNLREVLKAAHRARDLVLQILAFSRRNEQGKKPVRVDAILREALKMLRASLPSTIDIQTSVSSRLAVLADQTQIHQVLMNLCTNAGQAMRDHGGVLTVELADLWIDSETASSHPGWQAGPHVKLTVRDTGHGIAPPILDRIFDPFFTTKEPGVGTGLGLAVVHGIVKSHGGVIEVESVPGEGTAFHVYVPAMKGAEESHAAEAEDIPCGFGRILLVDDEPMLALATKRMLERLGYEVEHRLDGSEALEVFRSSQAETPFELVITDMTMPRLTGADLARELLKLEPDLPVVLCTGFSEIMDKEMAKSLGIRAYLIKPVIARELAETVRDLLAERRK